MNSQSPKYAGYWARMWAYNVDLLILLLAYYLFSMIITDDTLLYITCLFTTILYHALFESSPWQATPGKRIMRIIVTDDSGEKISLVRGIIRFLLKLVSLLIFYIGFIMIGFHKKGKGLHDLISGTLVISMERNDTP